MWSSQNQIQHIIPIATQIDWNATWLFLNNNHKRSYNYTNFQLCQSKLFRINNFLPILPTLLYLNSLNPKHSKHTKCISCNQSESQFHWLFCTSYNNISQIIHNTITQFSFSDLSDITNIQIQQICTNLINHQCLNPTYHSPFNTSSFITTIQGFILFSLINTISQYSSYKIASILLLKFF